MDYYFLIIIDTTDDRHIDVDDKLDKDKEQDMDRSKDMEEMDKVYSKMVPLPQILLEKELVAQFVLLVDVDGIHNYDIHQLLHKEFDYKYSY